MTAVLTEPFQVASSRRGRLREWLSAWWPELVILAGALVLFTWGLDKNGYGNPYYAGAVRSMTDSWKNFLFGAADPGGWITTDKPPLALWLAATSARIFGFSSWALLMPSALAGVASVGLLMATVRRAWGRLASRVAGVVFVLTPVVVAVVRVNNPDATLVLCLVAAAYATQRAISEERPGWLIVAGVCCGLAFLAKLLVAGVVMPGAFGAYLLAGPGGWWRRLRDVTLAGAAFLVVAGSWVALMDLTPASTRPYVALSSNNTAVSLVFGANGFGRLTGSQTIGAPGGLTIPTGFAINSLPGLGGTPGISRLFNAEMGDQVLWLVIPAALACLGGLVLVLRRRLTRPEAGSLVLWVGYALVSYLVFAYTQGIYHDYYVSALAPAIAALVGIGVTMVVRAGRPAIPWVLVALAGTAALEVVFLRRVEAYRELRVLVPIGLGVVVLVLLAALGVQPLRRHLGVIVGAGLVVALVAPAAWSLSGVRHAEDAAYASAGPALKGQGRGSSASIGLPSPTAGGSDLTGSHKPRGAGVDVAGIGGGGGLTTPELAWLRRQHRHERWIVAVSSDIEAEVPIVHGYSVMPMGGFYGTDPAMTRDRLAGLVASHQLRFVDTGGFNLGDPNQINALVASACTHVDPKTWGGASPGTLYDCAGRQHAIRTVEVRASSLPGVGQYHGLRLGPPAALERLLSCFHEHHWNPTTPSVSLSTPTARQAIAACAALIPAAVPSV